MVKNKRLSKSISDVAWSEFMRQLECLVTTSYGIVTSYDIMKQEAQLSKLV